MKFLTNMVIFNVFWGEESDKAIHLQQSCLDFLIDNSIQYLLDKRSYHTQQNLYMMGKDQWHNWIPRKNVENDHVFQKILFMFEKWSDFHWDER